DFLRVVEQLEPLRRVAELRRGALRDDVPIRGEAPRRLADIGPGEFAGAVLLERQREPGDRSRHAARPPAEDGRARALEYVAIGADVHVARGRAWSPFAIVDDDLSPRDASRRGGGRGFGRGVRQMDYHE